MKMLWAGHTDSFIYQDALSIRKKVFVDEQKVPEDLEIDDLEDKSFHLVVYSNHQAVATARIVEIAPQIYKVQRVAVLMDYRSRGVGKKVMQEAEHKIHMLGGTQIVLEAQLHAIPFYTSLGYRAEGEEFEDAGILHRKMTKDIQPSII